MPALAGDNVAVTLDDASGTPRAFAAGDIISVDLGLTYDQHDVTGFLDAVHKVINGQLKAPVTLKGYLTTTASIGTHTVIQGALSAGVQVTLEVRIYVNGTPQSGDPKFTGEFYIASYSQSIAPGGAITFTATLNPAIGTAPAWSVV